MAQTISEAIGADHQAIDLYADNIKAASDEAEKVRWRNQFTWTLARHAISEELTLYPTMEKHLGEEGRKLTSIDKAQHQVVKEHLYQLQDMEPANPEFMPLLDRLLANLHEHIEHESEEDMPRLEKILSKNESEDLAASFQRTKGIVPTRSHPAAPTEYYAENLAALLTTPIDRFQDWFRAFPENPDQKLGEGKS